MLRENVGCLSKKESHEFYFFSDALCIEKLKPIFSDLFRLICSCANDRLPCKNFGEGIETYTPLVVLRETLLKLFKDFFKQPPEQDVIRTEYIEKISRLLICFTGLPFFLTTDQSDKLNNIFKAIHRITQQLQRDISVFYSEKQETEFDVIEATKEEESAASSAVSIPDQLLDWLQKKREDDDSLLLNKACVLQLFCDIYYVYENKKNTVLSKTTAQVSSVVFSVTSAMSSFFSASSEKTVSAKSFCEMPEIKFNFDNFFASLRL